jgi:hypothetical protein
LFTLSACDIQRADAQNPAEDYADYQRQVEIYWEQTRETGRQLEESRRQLEESAAQLEESRRQLKERSYFQQVRVSMGTVGWPKGQDFCPDTLFEESKVIA